uniref:Tetratricopeptide repeat protein n=1 Tax=Parascaris equorum TaxID=6256 RepID=A0A914R6M1_PAREQ
LERKLAKAIRDKNDRVTSDLYVELGEEYRRVGDIRRALERYSSGAQFAEHIDADENAAFAHRAIAEISVHPG